MTERAEHRDSPEARLAALLVQAHRSKQPLEHLPAELTPRDEGAAYRVQRGVLVLRRQPVAGWKVGAKSPSGAVHGAPLPRDSVLPSPAELGLAAFRRPGLELEIAFRFGRDFAPADEPYAEAEVLAGIAGVCATIEVVASRFADHLEPHRLAKLADLQNHGALVVGEEVAYRPDIAWGESLPARLRVGGRDVASGASNNPAGDPRRLMTWLVNHCTTAGQPFAAGTWVTTGTYTGVHFPEGPCEVRGEIAGLPAVELRMS